MSHSHHVTEPENHRPEGRVVQPWEPRTKLVAGLFFLFGVISLNDLRLLAGALAFSILFSLWAGLGISQLVRKLSVLIPFLLLMSLPLIFSAGYPPAPDRVIFAALIVFKALTAMTFTLFVFTNQPIEGMLEAMEHLKVPAAITTVIYLAYRYGFLFIQEVQTTLRALKSRLFDLRLNRYSLPIYGELSGGLFIKSLNRSETVCRAMSSRSFQGNMPIGAPRRIIISDIVRAALPTGFIILLIIVEQVVL
jgi:cobalt/nickel transport system permease protein